MPATDASATPAQRAGCREARQAGQRYPISRGVLHALES